MSNYSTVGGGALAALGRVRRTTLTELRRRCRLLPSDAV
jgi:hypothetical protein